MSLRILNLENECTACGACVSICPRTALKLKSSIEGFYYPYLEEGKCINCGACEKVCHVLNPIEKDVTPSFYMAKSKSKSILQKSSSGGLFTLLANEVLKEGGIVYGARYNYQKERLEHSSTDFYSLDELKKSKYMESFLGDIFSLVRENLKSDRLVLFSGTPCQIVGLKSFLSKQKTDKLILIDFICHGVPSNQHFTEYKHYEEKKHKSKVAKIDFRPKFFTPELEGWRQSRLYLEFDSGKTLLEQHRLNYYYTMFQKNLFLRKSCYRCKYRKNHSSDITLADFWGIIRFQPNNRNNEGISMIAINTTLGKSVFEKLHSEIIYEKLPHSAVTYAYEAKNYPINERKIISKEIQKVGYMKTVIKLLRKKILYLKFIYFLQKIKHTIEWNKKRK